MSILLVAVGDKAGKWGVGRKAEHLAGQAAKLFQI